MLRYRITEPAKLDLMGIWREIALDNRQAANGVVKHLENHFEVLAESPRMGRIRAEFSTELHVFPSFKSGWRSTYMIFYRIADVGIEIIRVIEAHRKITQEFFER